MCRKHNPRKIDSCMRDLIRGLNIIISPRYKIVACCCGHSRYPMTIIYKIILREEEIGGSAYAHDLISGLPIPRRKRFYKQDAGGYYYIPETLGYFEGDEK